jgi:hypothetical protein
MRRVLLFLPLGAMMMSSVARADIVRISDGSETLSASLVNDIPNQVGSISTPVINQALELVSFTYTLPVGITFGNTVDQYRQMIDPVGDDTPGKISDIFRVMWQAGGRTASITFASDLDNNLPPSLDITGSTQLPNIVENGDFQEVNRSTGATTVIFQVSSDVPEPSSLLLMAGGIMLLAISILKHRQRACE